MKTTSFTITEQEYLPIRASAYSRVVRNDNDSNPFPGWDRAVLRN